MELFIYKCPLCGFSHQIPAYWLDYVAKPEYEFEHISFQTKEICDNRILVLKEEEQG